MNLKRASLVALAAFVIPGMAMAQAQQTITQRIYVEKTFFDDNDAEVAISYECNDGLPSSGSAMIGPGAPGHTFVIEELTGDNPVECIVIEEDAAALGYEVSYKPFTDVSGYAFSDEGCKYVWPDPDEIEADDDTDEVDYVVFSTDGQARCEIYNKPELVEVIITKEWDLTGTQEAFEDTTARIIVEADTYFERKNAKGNWVPANCGKNFNNCRAVLNFVGENPAPQSVMVYPEDIDGSNVYLSEKGVDSYVDASNNCNGVVEVKANQGGSCTFTNVVFYEGIPTLSQYGLALLALLMLGVGFVGFRRFV